MSSSTGLREATAELVIVVERDTMSTNVLKFAETLALIDALDAALAAEAAANNYIDRWTITPQVTDWGWSLVTTVEASW